MTEFVIKIKLKASNEKDLFDWLVQLDEVNIDIDSEVIVSEVRP